MTNIYSLLLILLIIYLTNIVQTITGFAGSMLAMPFLLMLMNMSDAKILIVLVGVVWSIWMLGQNFNKVNWKFVWLLSLAMTIGIIIGIFLLKVVSLKLVIFLMGIIIIISALKNLFFAKLKTTNKFWDVLFGVSSGVMQAMVLMGGPFLVLVADNYLKDREEYRTTLAVLWLVINFVLLFIYWMQNLYTIQIFELSFVSVIPLLLAIFTGNALNKKINNRQFQILVNILLIVSGLLMFSKLL